MKTALDVLQRALRDGDPGARSFLERTSSIYVLDATNGTLFGCWNFLHRALNEFDRFDRQECQDEQHLLAQFAVKVARRSSPVDRQLVQTCIENYVHAHHGDGHESRAQLQQLVPENAELREIVMGRIAAFAFDPANHKLAATTAGGDDDDDDEEEEDEDEDDSWFAVLDTYHKALAANSLYNGPSAIRHLLCDWIIPSSDTLPPFSVSSIVLHVALEAAALAAPANTQETLQQLSAQVMSKVLVPTFRDAVVGTDTPTDGRARIVQTSVRAIHGWCAVTGLSLAQVQHISSKVGIGFVEVLGDAMSSDSTLVMDAIADLMEFVVDQHPCPPKQPDGTMALVSPARFTQTRYIMGVPDEESFKANVTEQQLYAIESKELGAMLEVLASRIPLQAYRLDQQHPVGHALARILVATCTGYNKIVRAILRNNERERSKDGAGGSIVSTYQQWIPSPGCLDMLSKCASHPSVVICAFVLPIITPVLATEVGLATQWLPILQRRAIIPHHFSQEEGTDAPLSLAAYDVCSVGFEDFVRSFRETVLTDALLACFASHPEYYFASCTAAIEEFCTSEATTAQTSLNLEAALYCMTVVADEVLVRISSSSNPPSPDRKSVEVNATGASDPTTTEGSASNKRIRGSLERCTAAIARKPKSLSNPLTLSQACHFVQKYDKWFCSDQPPGVLDTAADLSLWIFNQCATEFPDEPISVAVRQECGVMPYGDAARSLETLLCHNPGHFLSNKAIAALGAGWEATFTACNRSQTTIEMDDRKALCKGICYVLSALPESQQTTSLMALAMPSLGCLESMIQKAGSCGNDDRDMRSAILDRAAAEIVILTCIARSYTDADAASANTVRERTSDTYAALAKPALFVLRRSWSNISTAASAYGVHDSILRALGIFLVECLPPECNDDASLSLLRELCMIARLIVDGDKSRQSERFFHPIISFLTQYLKFYGSTVEKAARSRCDGRTTPSIGDKDKEVMKQLESLICATVQGMKMFLGPVWADAQQQGNGQPAFESKARPVTVVGNPRISSIGLPALFSLLRCCAERCPFFLLQLRDCSEDEGDENGGGVLLLRRALDSAVPCLLDPQAELSVASISFVESIFAYSDSSDETVQHIIVEEFNSRVKSSVLCTLLMGCTCGKINASVIPDACCLLFKLIRPLSHADLRALVEQSLNQDNFLLGKEVQRAVLSGIVDISLLDLEKMMTSLWEFHHVETPEILQSSDAIQRFCQNYRKPKQLT